MTSKLRFVSRVVGHRLDRLDRLGISRQRCLNFGENCNTHEGSNIYKVEPLYVVLNRAMQCFFVPQYPSRKRTCRHRVFPMFTRRIVASWAAQRLLNFAHACSHQSDLEFILKILQCPGQISENPSGCEFIHRLMPHPQMNISSIVAEEVQRLPNLGTIFYHLRRVPLAATPGKARAHAGNLKLDAHFTITP